MCGQYNILWILGRCVVDWRQWTNLERWSGRMIRLYIFRLDIDRRSSWWEFFTNGARNDDFFRIIIGDIIVGVRSCRWIGRSCCRPGRSFRWSRFDCGDGWQNGWHVRFRYCGDNGGNIRDVRINRKMIDTTYSLSRPEAIHSIVPILNKSAFLVHPIGSLCCKQILAGS